MLVVGNGVERDDRDVSFVQNLFCTKVQNVFEI